MSIRSWLGEFAEATQLAEFLQQEMPIRYAERIRNIDTWEGCCFQGPVTQEGL